MTEGSVMKIEEHGGVAPMARPPLDAAALAAHGRQVLVDLEKLQLPHRQWLPPGTTPEGAPLFDVVVIGAGMYGLAAAAALRLAGIQNVLVLEREKKGSEGPWVTYARMPTLRSPKELPGISLDIPSLTFRAWYEAAYGEDTFRQLYKVWNQDWQDYLVWFQDVMSLPVRHGCEVKTVEPRASWVDVRLQSGERVQARRVVIATGRNGNGGANLPAFVSAELFPDRAAHTFEEIDFSTLAGRDVAIIGAGASAWDNAATALEAGAKTVTMYARRRYLPQINKGRATHIGFLEGWNALDDAQRWELALFFERIQSPPPHETIHRTMRHANFSLRLGSAIKSVHASGVGVAISLADREDSADFVIVGTGFGVDLSRTPMLDAITPELALWRDRYHPPVECTSASLGLYPYLGPGFECQPKEQSADRLDLVHIFNAAAFVSHGHMASDVPGLTSSAQRISRAIVSHFFRESFNEVRSRMLSWNEHELSGTPLYVEVDPVTQIALDEKREAQG